MLRSAASASAVGQPQEKPQPDATGRPMLAIAAVALLGLAAVTFAYPSSSRMHTWPWALGVTLLWLLPILAIAIGAASRPVWRIPPWPITVGLGLLALSALASAVISPFSATSLPLIWPTLGGAALVFWLHHAHAWRPRSSATDPRANVVPQVFALAGALLVVVSLIQWSAGEWPLPWGSRNSAPFGHSTYTAGAIVLVLPWIALPIARGRLLVRIAWGLIAILALGVLASTSGRGGALGVACSASVATAGVIIFGDWSRGRKIALALSLVAVAIVMIATNPRLRDLVVHLRWSDAAAESNIQRRAMLEAGSQLGAERPLLGWGPGTVPLAYPRVRAGLDGGVENVLQLHTTPIQLWAITGAAGVLAMLLLILGTGVAVVRAPRTSTSLAATASLAGYAVVALTDHQLDLPAMTAAVAANLALLTSSSAYALSGYTPSRGLRFAVSAGLLGAIAIAAPATWRDLRGRQVYDGALDALEENRHDGFLTAANRAAAIAPHDAFYRHQYASALLEARARHPDPAHQRTLAREAADTLERSLATRAHEEFAHFNLGWLYLELGEPARSARHFIAAARLVPDKGGVYFGLGLAHLSGNNRDDAVRAFALEWINDPRTFTSPAWELPGLEELVPAIRDETMRIFANLQNEFAPAAAVEAWTRWWWSGTADVPPPAIAFNAEVARFRDALPGIGAHDPISAAPPHDAWAQLYAAWRTSDSADAFLVAARGDRAYAEALARRREQHPENFRAFLCAPTGEEAALVRTMRRQRIGYGVLARHPEGPVLSDVFIVQENRVTADFAADLLPRKGWLPGRFLLALLPPDPR